MSLNLLAIDLGKRSFHLYGIASDGVIVSRKVGRAKLAETVQALAARTIAMEACASSHHWGRLFISAGCDVRLINPRFVKPFVKGSKNDAADAEAIFEAASRPTMRFVPVKTIDQQDLQVLHRARERVVLHRTSLINSPADCSPSTGSSYPREHGASRHRRRRRSRVPSCPNLPARSSRICLTSLLISPIGSRNSTRGSSLCAAQMQRPDGLLYCPVSGRSSPPLS
jgi:transposase